MIKLLTVTSATALLTAIAIGGGLLLCLAGIYFGFMVEYPNIDDIIAIEGKVAGVYEDYYMKGEGTSRLRHYYLVIRLKANNSRFIYPEDYPKYKWLKTNLRGNTMLWVWKDKKKETFQSGRQIWQIESRNKILVSYEEIIGKEKTTNILSSIALLVIGFSALCTGGFMVYRR